MPFDHRDNALWPHCLSLNIQVRKNPYDVVPKHPVSSNMGLGKQFAVALNSDTFTFITLAAVFPTIGHKEAYLSAVLYCMLPSFLWESSGHEAQSAPPTSLLASLTASAALAEYPSAPILSANLCEMALRPPLLYTGPYFLPV